MNRRFARRDVLRRSAALNTLAAAGVVAACGTSGGGAPQGAAGTAGTVEKATISHLFWETPGGVDRTKARVAEFDDFRAPAKCLYDSPEAIEALTYLGELYTRYQVTPTNVTQALGANDINSFGAGKLALNARWTAPISQYRTQATFKWGWRRTPRRRMSSSRNCRLSPRWRRQR